jgi:prepilin-type processing-associated H-X9-DG protein
MPRGVLRPPRPGRGGFNRLELVIVLGILLVVVGLFLVVVPRMRERANRLHCQNNLRIVGEAVYLYRDQANPPALPPSRIADRYATWAVLIAPYLERGKRDPTLEWDDSLPYARQPDEVRQTQLRVYYCPSRRPPGANSVSADLADNAAGGPNYPGALSDYACAAGDGDPRRPWTSARANGALVPGQVLRRGPGDTIRRWRGRTDIWVHDGDRKAPRVEVRLGTDRATDVRQGLRSGTSQTILIGEKHVPPSAFGHAEQGDGSAYNGGRPASFSRVGGPGHEPARSVTDPMDMNFPVFGSYHPGVCQFLMADGSVRGLSPLIKGEILGQLIVRDDQ